MASHIGRRKFLATLCGAVAPWPLAASAQQAGMPVIGFLYSQSADPFANRLRGFHRGLKEIGYVEGENLAIVYGWAEGRFDQLPMLAGELVHRQVAVIVAAGQAEAVAAKAATTTIPIVFSSGEDPVRLGLVASLARPGGNLTGINLNVELVAKRLELLRELVPGIARVAVLVNPAVSLPTTVETISREVEAAGRAMGLQIQVLNASTSRDIDATFAALVRERVDALFVSPGGFFNSRRVQLATMAARHGIPLTSSTREIAEAGGLMSYGTNLADVWRQLGVYTGRILKGAKPTDLPVVQSSKFELIINHQTARMLGISVPDKLLVAADEVIE
jgi:putative tryptophan/tyrosine transport system substrate-binding protein